MPGCVQCAYFPSPLRLVFSLLGAVTTPTPTLWRKLLVASASFYLRYNVFYIHLFPSVCAIFCSLVYVQLQPTYEHTNPSKALPILPNGIASNSLVGHKNRIAADQSLHKGSKVSVPSF